MERKLEKKNLLIITAFLTVIAFIIYLGITNYDLLFNKEEKEVKVANVTVTGLSKDKAIEKIQDKVDSWFGNQQFQLYFQNKNIPVTKDFVTIDVEKSYENALKNDSNELFMTIDEQELRTNVAAISNENLPIYIDYASLSAAISSFTNTLEFAEKKLNVYDYVISDYIPENTVTTAEQEIDSDSKNSIEVFVRNNPEVQIEASELFSLNNHLLESNGQYSDAVATYIASVLYQLSLQTNFEIYERHASTGDNELLTYGFESVMKKGIRDFSFYNPNKTAFTIQFELKEELLTASLKGVPLPYEYSTTVKNEKEIEPTKVIVQYDTGTRTKNTNEKKTGVALQIVRNEKTYDGAIVKEEIMSNDYYVPEFTVLVHPIIPAQQEEVELTEEEENVEQAEENEAFALWVQSIIEETIRKTEEAAADEETDETEESEEDEETIEE